MQKARHKFMHICTSLFSLHNTQQKTTTPAAHQPFSLDKQIQLEQLKHSNLQLQLELMRAQLELAKLSLNVQITDDMRADITLWIYLLQHYNGLSVIPSNVTIANPNLFAYVSVKTSSAVFLLPFWL